MLGMLSLSHAEYKYMMCRMEAAGNGIDPISGLLHKQRYVLCVVTDGVRVTNTGVCTLCFHRYGSLFL